MPWEDNDNDNYHHFQQQSRRHKRYLSYASRTLVPARYRKAYREHEEDLGSMGDLPAEEASTVAPATTMAEGKLSDDLKSLAIKLGTQGPHKTLPTPRLIQLLFNGVYILKTTAAIFVWEHPYYPQLYIPAAVLHSYFAARSADLQITPGENISHPENSKQILATQWTITVRSKKIDKVICFANQETLPEPAKPLAGLVKIDFASIDQWFEESTPIFVHPKDPFKRIDILQSTRHIVVKLPLSGPSETSTSTTKSETTAETEETESAYRIVADTFSSMHLYETGLPCRFYIPLARVDASVLRKSSTTTKCPYKGEASYYDVVIPSSSSPTSPNPSSSSDDEIVFEDIVWYYPTPLLESAKIENLVCFYNEKVRIEVDGEVLEQPVTPFSKGGAGGEDKLKLNRQIKQEDEGEEVLNMGSLGTPLAPLKEEKGLEG
ncbi:hypothetical protein CB0940_11457 [Cercospora beticola]|uniref:DUF427 domain-containing protein n=1 Tax=Cercospora beticola TaxID=122368 RepID=A0A2G5HEV9_CERBT|nr:hypothetical protein CB0940_11457 [Cercospora beticola]PIA90752.1 hypothetical protein CB0940_11457 [Cercospora beticola]WPB08316.1 hypothetical protein RHO25_012982 [Cercospora beticola]CAK1367801.1 unnamed protein product [Cercospora beticola]